jgi:hypothetical protein
MTSVSERFPALVVCTSLCCAHHYASSATGGMGHDMNTDTDQSDCIVVDPGGGDVGRRGAGLPASPDPTGAAASAEVGKVAVEEGGGGKWIRVIR